MERETLKNFMEELEVNSTQIYSVTENSKTFFDNVTLLKGNRGIQEKKVLDLMNAFIEGEFIPAIYVAVPSYQVFEGNHRFTAFKKLIDSGVKDIKMEVIFIKNERPLETCLTINNSQTPWKETEIFNSLCKAGNDQMIKLRKWMLERSEYFVKGEIFNIGAAMQILTGKRVYLKNYKNFSFSDRDVEKAEPIYEELKAICSVLGTNLPVGRGRILAWKEVRKVDPNFSRLLRRLSNYKGELPGDGRRQWKVFYLQFMDVK